MAIVDEVLKALNNIPGWKRISEAPEKIAALEKRIAALEQRLAGSTGELCPICNEPQFKRVKAVPHPDFGSAIMVDTFECQACSHQELRDRTTMK